jgi:hypothetical protein
MLSSFIHILSHFIGKMPKFEMSKQKEKNYEKGIDFICSEYGDGVLSSSIPVAIGMGREFQRYGVGYNGMEYDSSWKTGLAEHDVV